MLHVCVWFPWASNPVLPSYLPAFACVLPYCFCCVHCNEISDQAISGWHLHSSFHTAKKRASFRSTGHSQEEPSSLNVHTTLLWSGLHFAVCWRRRQNKQLRSVRGEELCMPNEAIMSEWIELSSSRSEVECLFVERGGKKTGGGENPKNIVQFLSACEWRGKRGERERATEWSVSGLARCGRGEMEWEKIRGRRISEELKASEWNFSHNYTLAASRDDFSEGTPCSGERREEGGGRRACDSEKRCLFDWALGCFPTWQPPVRSVCTPSTSAPFWLNRNQILVLIFDVTGWAFQDVQIYKNAEDAQTIVTKV